MYSKNGTVIFTTGRYIEDNKLRNDRDYQLVEFVLEEGERIIGICSHIDGEGEACHRNV